MEIQHLENARDHGLQLERTYSLQHSKLNLELLSYKNKTLLLCFSDSYYIIQQLWLEYRGCNPDTNQDCCLVVMVLKAFMKYCQQANSNTI